MLKLRWDLILVRPKELPQFFVSFGQRHDAVVSFLGSPSVTVHVDRLLEFRDLVWTQFSVCLLTFVKRRTHPRHIIKLFFFQER